MKAFLKRRGILLSGAVVLLGCACLDIWKATRPPRAAATFGIINGSAEYSKFETNGPMDHWNFRSWETPLIIDFHLPRFGGASVFEVTGRNRHFVVPLWLPLLAILGWIVFRELRWREMRAKLSEAAPTQ